MAARLCRVPAILNVTGLGTAFLGSSGLQSLALLLYRIGFARAHTVFFQNTDDRAFLLDRGVVKPDRARLIPGSGVDIDHFAPRPVRPGSGTRFLMVSRLLTDKGVREYVSAARALRHETDEVHCAILGAVGAENRTAIGQREVDAWTAEGTIDHHPPVGDIRPCLERADCVVLPSYREGMSRVLLEAAAMAKPTIATDVPGCREIVDDGVTGYLCRARDAEALAGAMRRFVGLTAPERAAMGERARRKIVNQFSEQRVIDAYREAICDAAALS